MNKRTHYFSLLSSIIVIFLLASLMLSFTFGIKTYNQNSVKRLKESFFYQQAPYVLKTFLKDKKPPLQEGIFHFDNLNIDSPISSPNFYGLPPLSFNIEIQKIEDKVYRLTLFDSIKYKKTYYVLL